MSYGITCDYCKKSEEGGWRYVQNIKGWRGIEIEGRWLHFCPSCWSRVESAGDAGMVFLFGMGQFAEKDTDHD